MLRDQFSCLCKRDRKDSSREVARAWLSPCKTPGWSSSKTQATWQLGSLVEGSKKNRNNEEINNTTPRKETCAVLSDPETPVLWLRLLRAMLRQRLNPDHVQLAENTEWETAGVQGHSCWLPE